MSLESSETKRRLVQGRGTYVADILPAGTLHVAFVRSYEPFGLIRRIDSEAARALPGVRRVVTGRDLCGSLLPLRIEGPGNAAHSWFPLAIDRVRFVGEPLAMVIAEDPYTAEDAAGLVAVEIDPIEAIVTVDRATSAEPINLEAGTNVLFESRKECGDVDAAFATAGVVIERIFEQARQTPLPLETRGVLATADPFGGGLTVYTSTQIPHMVQMALAESLRRPEHSIRVITPNVGGGFGLKAHVFPEEVAVAWLAGELGQPVRWIEDRRENLIASAHAHEVRVECRLGADPTGRIVGLDLHVTADIGAYGAYPFGASLEPMTTSGFVLAGYRVPSIRLVARGVSTNKCPTGAYRGVGIPLGVFAGERLLDLLAQELGLGRDEVRIRNLVTSDEMPYTNGLGAEWDNGDYHAAFRDALAHAEYSELEKERENMPVDGPVLGLGVAFFNEHSGTGSAAYRSRGVTSIPGFDGARVVIEPGGEINVYASSADAGQDHEQAYRLVVSHELQVDLSRVHVVEGDTATCPPGSGTFASRAASAQISTVALAARKLAQRLAEVASILLECDPASVRASEEVFVCSTTGRTCGFDDVVAAGHLRHIKAASPSGFEPGLEAQAFFDLPLPTYPYGAHVAAVELDRDTFQVRLRRYVAVEDCGVVINEAAVHEQMVGAISMGLGSALLEELHYDTDGQIRTSTLLDYYVPLATDVIAPELYRLEHPTDRTPLGTKGVAEAGTIGALAAIGIAVADAVAQLGGEVNHLPMSPERLFAAVVGAGSETSPISGDTTIPVDQHTSGADPGQFDERNANDDA